MTIANYCYSFIGMVIECFRSSGNGSSSSSCLEVAAVVAAVVV